MTLPSRRAFLYRLALIIVAGAGMSSCKATIPDKSPYLCYADKGYMMSNRSCLQIDDYMPVTKEEAVEYAQDVAMLLIDSRLHSKSCEPIRIETDEVKLGWRIRLYLPNSQDQWVDITVGRTNGLGSIKSHGPKFTGASGPPPIAQYIMSASFRQAEHTKGDENSIAAYAAMDMVRVLGNTVAGIYTSRVEKNEDGEWNVVVIDIDCPEATWKVRLSTNYFLLDFRYTWGF